MATTVSPAAVRPASAAATLPPAPDTTTLRLNVAARLHAIEKTALPSIAVRRQLLEDVWRSDAADAELLFADEDQIIPVHPAGAERLASTLAEQYALLAEADALRGLAAALDEYEAGGAGTARECDVEPQPSLAGVASHAVADVDDRARTIHLLRYLTEVRRDIWAARRRRDVLECQQLEEESQELEERIRRRSAAMQGMLNMTTPAMALPRSA